MISCGDFRNGVTIEIDNNVWQIVDFQHVKPGKGAAFVRTKMKNVRSGAVVERTFNPNEKFPKARIDTRQMQYLYENDGQYNFMDNETYEQSELTAAQLGDAVKYLKENMEITINFFQGNVIGVDLPVAVALAVIETDPGIRVILQLAVITQQKWKLRV